MTLNDLKEGQQAMILNAEVGSLERPGGVPGAGQRDFLAPGRGRVDRSLGLHAR